MRYKIIFFSACAPDIDSIPSAPDNEEDGILAMYQSAHRVGREVYLFFYHLQNKIN